MGESDSVTALITRTVKPGREADFERALHDFVQRSLALPGQQGVHIMRPAPGTDSREYGIVRKFARREDFDRFHASDLYRDWCGTVAELTEGPSKSEQLNGLESWFTLPNAPLRPLPNWKMAIATFLAVDPVTTVLAVFLAPRLQGLNIVVYNAIFNVFVVGLLTWLVMPLVTRLLHGWLHP